MLRMIELQVRAIPWQFGDEKKRGNPPEPMPYPEPEADYQEKPRRESREDYVTRRAEARAAQLRARKE